MTPQELAARIAADQRARAPAPAPPPPAKPTATLSIEPDRLREVIEALRASEANDPKRTPDLLVGEFLVIGARVPLSLVAGLQGLTRSEAAVLRFLGWGRSNADIGMLLAMSDSTVRSHLNNAAHKLELDGVRALNSLAGLLFHPVD